MPIVVQYTTNVGPDEYDEVVSSGCGSTTSFQRD